MARREKNVWEEAARLLRETNLTYKDIGERIGRSGQAVSVFCRQQKLRALDYLNRPDREITADFVEDCRRLAGFGDVKPVIAEKLGCNLRDVFRALVGDEWLESVFASPAKREKRSAPWSEKIISGNAEAWLPTDYIPYKTGDTVRIDQIEGFISASAIWIEPGDTRPLFAVPVFVGVEVRRRRQKTIRARGVYRFGGIRQNALRVLGGAGGKMAGVVFEPAARWECDRSGAVVGVVGVAGDRAGGGG